MDIKTRALYNSLRMNWLLDNSLPVEKWQIEDYREMSFEEIFDRLDELDVSLDEVSFTALADTVETPEEMTDAIVDEMDLTSREQDKVYLLVFELWRRLATEKPSLSVFCDELDQQIHLYDEGIDNFEGMQDAIANLQMILEDNIDEGGNPHEIFEMIKQRCAHDLDTFLYDFISEQIDTGNELYASELLDGFNDFLEGNKWFDLIKVRLMVQEDPETADGMVKKLIQKASKEPDIEFNLEILSYLVQEGEKRDFVKLVKKTITLIETEDDFLDLLDICDEYLLVFDEDEKEKKLQSLIKKHNQNPPNNKIKSDHPDLKDLLNILA